MRKIPPYLRLIAYEPREEDIEHLILDDRELRMLKRERQRLRYEPKVQLLPSFLAILFIIGTIIVSFSIFSL